MVRDNGNRLGNLRPEEKREARWAEALIRSTLERGENGRRAGGLKLRPWRCGDDT